MARTPSLTLPIRCIYSAILNTLGAPLNPQDIPHNPHPCYKRTPSPSLMPGITGGLAPLLSPVLSSHLLLGSTHRKLGRDFGRTLSIPASLPYPPKTLPRQHPLRPRPSGHTLLPALRRGRRGRVFCSIPWHLLGRPPTGGGTAPELETLRCQRLSVKLRLWGLMRSDSDSSSMSDKRQSSHVQSQRVPESFRGESLVPRTAVLSQPLVSSPTACSENPRRLQGSERHVSAALCALRRAAVFFIPGFTRWETMIWGCWGEACSQEGAPRGRGRVSIAPNPGRQELAYPSGPRLQVPINSASLSRAVHADPGSPLTVRRGRGSSSAASASLLSFLFLFCPSAWEGKPSQQVAFIHPHVIPTPLNQGRIPTFFLLSPASGN